LGETVSTPSVRSKAVEPDTVSGPPPALTLVRWTVSPTLMVTRAAIRLPVAVGEEELTSAVPESAIGAAWSQLRVTVSDALLARA
jgi:hypothetical protein